jgi:hypothetical protein
MYRFRRNPLDLEQMQRQAKKLFLRSFRGWSDLGRDRQEELIQDAIVAVYTELPAGSSVEDGVRLVASRERKRVEGRGPGGQTFELFEDVAQGGEESSGAAVGVEAMAAPESFRPDFEQDPTTRLDYLLDQWLKSPAVMERTKAQLILIHRGVKVFPHQPERFSQIKKIEKDAVPSNLRALYQEVDVPLRHGKSGKIQEFAERSYYRVPDAMSDFLDHHPKKKGRCPTCRAISNFVRLGFDATQIQQTVDAILGELQAARYQRG